MHRDIAKERTIGSVACIFLIVMASFLSMILLSVITADGSDASEGDLGNLHWELEGDVLTFTGSGAMYDGYTEYDTDRDWDKDDVRTIIIGDGITSIGNYIFNGHTNLEYLTIGKDVTIIGTSSFQLCGNLRSVYLPDSVLSLGESSFAHCTGMTDISFSNVTTIGSNAFRGIIFDNDAESGIVHSVENLAGRKFVKNNVNAHMELIGWRVTYDSMGGSPVEDSYVANGAPLMPPADPTRDGFTFDQWCREESCSTPYVFSDPVTSSLKLYAKWDAVTPTYQVRFLSEGQDFKVYLLSIGDTIYRPTEAPTKDTDTKYEYVFSHWDGYTENMTLSTPGATFDAVYDRTIKLNKDGSRLSLVDTEATKMQFSSDRISSIVSMATADSELTLTVNLENCIVHFDNKALRSLKAADCELSVSKLSPGDLTDAQKKIIGDHTAYSISFGENKDFNGGKVTFTFTYSLEDGNDADDLYVAYISDGEIKEEFECTYEDGKLSFSTGHLSIYTVLYKEAKRTNFLADLDFGSFLSFGIVLAIAISGVIYFVLKKMK